MYLIFNQHFLIHTPIIKFRMEIGRHDNLIQFKNDRRKSIQDQSGKRGSVNVKKIK